MKKYTLLVFLVIGWSELYAQELDLSNKGAFDFSYANDFTSMTDKYYTNGVGFALTLPVFSASPFNPKWLRNSNFSSSYHSINFQYDVFTPDLKVDLYTDRPFAATMMIGSKHQYVYLRKSLRITSELRLGLIGQAAGAGKLQNGLHELMPGADRVEGWDTQIRNDIGVNYIFSVEKLIEISKAVEIIGGVTTFVGTPYTKIEPSITARIGVFNHYFDILSQENKRNWQAYLTLGGTGSVVGYNATLQGGLFNQSNPYTLSEINHFVAKYNLGIGLTYGNTDLVIVNTFITPEFPEGDSHSWTELKLIFRF